MEDASNKIVTVIVVTAGINKPYARRYLNTNLQLDLLKNRYLTRIKKEFLLNLKYLKSAFQKRKLIKKSGYV